MHPCRYVEQLTTDCMKCTDIQINDWVYLSEATKYAMRVTSIDEDHCYLDFEGNEGDPFDGIYGERDGIAPVPLTEEIMRANGFCLINSQEWAPYFYNEKQDIIISADYIVHIADIGCTKITYVHEFQHLLRLCGLDYLADNFKIE